MKKALIGFSGLIGKNLKDQTNFQYKFNTKNINSIQKQSFNIVVCAAAPGKMHIANQYPEEDKKKIQSLIKNLKKLKTDKFILISTIQVFEKLNNKNNEYSKKYNNSITYGKNRRMLEVFCKKHFKDFLIIRLPSVFGKHLKKNFIFDLFNSLPMMLNNDRYQKILNKIPYEIKKNFKSNYRKKNEKFYLKKNLNISKLNKKKIEVFLKKNNLDATSFTNHKSLFQYYYLGNLWKDINIAIKNKLKVLNLACEPIMAKNIYKQILKSEMKINNSKLYRANMISNYGNLWNSKSKYLYNKNEILKQIKKFYFKKK